MKGRVHGGALDLGVDVRLHAQHEDDTLQVLVQHSKMEEVLTTGIHLHRSEQAVISNTQ